MFGYLKKKIPTEVREENQYFRNKEVVYNEVRNDYDYDYRYENQKNNQMVSDNYYYGDSRVNTSQTNNVVDMGTNQNVVHTNVVDNKVNLTDSNVD